MTSSFESFRFAVRPGEPTARSPWPQHVDAAALRIQGCFPSSTLRQHMRDPEAFRRPNGCVSHSPLFERRTGLGGPTPRPPGSRPRRHPAGLRRARSRGSGPARSVKRASRRLGRVSARTRGGRLRAGWRDGRACPRRRSARRAGPPPAGRSRPGRAAASWRAGRSG